MLYFLLQELPTFSNRGQIGWLPDKGERADSKVLTENLHGVLASWQNGFPSRGKTYRLSVN